MAASAATGFELLLYVRRDLYTTSRNESKIDYAPHTLNNASAAVVSARHTVQAAQYTVVV